MAHREFQQLEADGTPVNPELRAQFSPTLNAHINKIGKFEFDIDHNRTSASQRSSNRTSPRRRDSVAGELLIGPDRRPAPRHPESPLDAAQNTHLVIRRGARGLLPPAQLS